MPWSVLLVELLQLAATLQLARVPEHAYVLSVLLQTLMVLWLCVRRCAGSSGLRMTAR